MVISRKSIISKAESCQITKDAGETAKPPVTRPAESEDVWFDKHTLYRDHINEVLQKWKNIDDQIWGKIVVFERNQRVAKAYLRTNRVNINSSTIAFDGHKIGLSGFKACFHDEKVNLVKHRIGKGIDLCIEENGNISACKVNSKCELIVRPYDPKCNSLPDKLLLSDGVVGGGSGSGDFSSPSVIFDLHKFKCNIFKELNSKTDRTKVKERMENQCINTVIFIRESSTSDCLLNPVWLLLINIVALDFLRSKFIDLLLNVHLPVMPQSIHRQQFLSDKEYLNREHLRRELMSREPSRQETSKESANGELNGDRDTDPASREHRRKELNSRAISNRPDKELISQKTVNQHKPSSSKPSTESSKDGFVREARIANKIRASDPRDQTRDLNRNCSANGSINKSAHNSTSSAANSPATSTGNSPNHLISGGGSIDDYTHPLRFEATRCVVAKQTDRPGATSRQLYLSRNAHSKQPLANGARQIDLQSSSKLQNSSKSSSNLKSDPKPAHRSKASNSVSNLMAMFKSSGNSSSGNSSGNESTKKQDLSLASLKAKCPAVNKSTGTSASQTKVTSKEPVESGGDQANESNKSKRNPAPRSSKEVKKDAKEAVKPSNNESTKELKETSKEIVKEVIKEPAKSQNATKALAKECSKKETKKEPNRPLSNETVAAEDEVIISNKTKLIEKKLIDEMQNQSSRDAQTNPSSTKEHQPATQPPPVNSLNKTSSSANLKSNAYKHGYLSAYENSAQKHFNRLLYAQNSFDSGFYSPSSNDSYNLSSTSGSCNALVYCSTSGSEQNTLNTNGEFVKKEFDKDSSIYLDSIDSPPSANMKMMPNRTNLARPIAHCFNGTSFTYWSANNSYRKYYSTEILSDWN